MPLFILGSFVLHIVVLRENAFVCTWNNSCGLKIFAMLFLLLCQGHTAVISSIQSQLLSSENFPVHCSQSKCPQTDATLIYCLNFLQGSLYLKGSDKICIYSRINSVRKCSSVPKTCLGVALWPILYSLQQFKV